MSFPTTPVFNALNIKSNSPTLVSETASGRMQSRKVGSQKWSFTAAYPPMTQADFKPVWAYVIARGGRHGVFSVTPPVVSSTSGTGTGSVTCSATTVGNTSVTIAGLTGTLKAGDFVKFANHTKVYMLASDRSGAGAITIEPPLIAAIASNEQMYFDNVAFTVRLANDIQGFDVGTDALYRVNEIDFVEAF